MLDKLGIWVSGLCALHCLSLPILVPLIPLVAASFFAQAWFERTILSISILVGLVALVSGAIRQHGQVYPVILLISGATIYWFKNIFGESFEPFTIAFGALLIAIAHVSNLRLCRQSGKSDTNYAGRQLASASK
ncbi:MerC domain-containing protein [Alteromonas sp. ASW11-130]|uniref:MerC domain-containing protein n=1 Tax=Alteromonas sp. ASW11-130 TaxID=3015775 RepID=UPI0022418DD4|nr:MerC domain-containing protein [Alteromonas sp. ASW11-130]MCW8090885.1 MerC domain-containing protein [Alteromonas sp. ASW11-130]